MYDVEGVGVGVDVGADEGDVDDEDCVVGTTMALVGDEVLVDDVDVEGST